MILSSMDNLKVFALVKNAWSLSILELLLCQFQSGQLPTSLNMEFQHQTTLWNAIVRKTSVIWLSLLEVKTTCKPMRSGCSQLNLQTWLRLVPRCISVWVQLDHNSWYKSLPVTRSGMIRLCSRKISKLRLTLNVIDIIKFQKTQRALETKHAHHQSWQWTSRKTCSS